MRKLLISIFVLLLFNSCGVYNTIKFEVLSPSEITIPNDVKTVAFVHRNIWSKADTAYLNKNKIKEKEQKAYNELIKICYSGFSDVILPTERYDTVSFYQMKQEIIEDDENTPMLSWDTVNSICSRLGADILVVLENSKFKVSREYYGNFDTPEIHNSIAWNFIINTYDPLYSKILDHKIYRDSIDLSTLSAYDNYDENINYEIENLSYSIGELYAMRINPFWKEVTRKIYSTGNKTLSAGYFYFNNNKYKTAILVWKKLVDNKKAKLAARACINISTANEMIGNIEEAKKYASLSLFYYRKYNAPPEEVKYAKKLIKELQIRIIQQKILKEQF